MLALLALLGLTSAAWSEQHSADPTSEMTSFTDFETLDRPTSPNTWLVAPAGSTPSLRADAQAPVFDLAPERLAAAWVEVLREQPRTRILGRSEGGLQVEAEQRSAVFGFVDRVSFRAAPHDEGRSTLFVYSRSQVGYYDFGVNRRRVTDWLAALQARVGDTSR